MRPGAPCADAPVRCAEKGGAGWFLGHLGAQFHGVYFAGDGEIDETLLDTLRMLAAGAEPVIPLVVQSAQGAAESTAAIAARQDAGITFLVDTQGLLAQRYDAEPGSFYLVRPDQHVCARWRSVDLEQVHAALACALARQAEDADKEAMTA
jgi:3-(3-hydroxy-phenyl)propionate hydroxylase